MKWMKRRGGLEKRLESVQHPGVRLKLIREARNSTAEFKGNCGLRALCEFLASKGDIKDDPRDRKIIKEIESGIRDFPEYLTENWLSFLDVTSEEAGIDTGEVQESEDPIAAAPARKSTSPNSQKVSKPTEKLVFHNHCEGLNLEIFVEQYAVDGSIHVHIFHDEPVPQKMLEDVRQGVRMGRAWVPEAFQKYANSPNPEDRQVVIPRKTVDLTK